MVCLTSPANEKGHPLGGLLESQRWAMQGANLRHLPCEGAQRRDTPGLHPGFYEEVAVLGQPPGLFRRFGMHGDAANDGGAGHGDRR